MNQAPIKSDTARPLAEIARELFSRTLAERLLLVRRLAEQLCALHRSGRIHRAIALDTVTVDAEGRPQLAEPPARRRFGRDDCDPEFCPPELAGAAAVELPADVEVAARLLQKGGYPIDPRRIDLYQLGVMLCRLLTGGPVGRYMKSPKAKSSVPLPARVSLARAVGFDADERFVDCEDLIDALDEAMRRVSAPAAASDEDTRRGAAGRARADDTPIHRRKSRAARAPAGDGDKLPFDRLGHFEILSEIGRGGMGNVYKGYDEDLQRTVAIKVLPLELARDAELVKRFHAEARSVARLDHANVVSVHFTGEEAGHHFFAMQYIAGESLAQRLDRSGCLALDDALDIAEQTLAGLQAAHAEGLIHRDIKPGNLLIEEGTGRVVLADFGLVRMLDDGSRITAAGTVLGTVDYIAPEQARGDPVDARADLYSLGVLLYRMLAGRLPFAAETPTCVVYQHAHEPAPPLRRAAPGLPAEVEAIVGRLLEKDPANRYQTAAEALEAIRAARGRPALPAETELLRPNAPARRKRRLSRAWAAAGLVGVTAAAALLLLAGHLRPDPSSPGPAPGEEAPLAATPHQDRSAPAVADVKLEPGQNLPHNQWIDALQYVEPSWHTVSGEWRREGSQVLADPRLMSRIVLPFEIDGNYDLATEFTRTNGEGSINIVIPVGQRACQLTLAGWKQSVHGLGMIDGKEPCDKNNPAAFRPASLVNERRYRVLVSVRNGKDAAAIDVFLDGKPLLTWKGNPGALTVAPVWRLPYPKQAALGANDSTVTFHNASLRSVSGKARLAPRPAPPFDEAPDQRWVDLLAGVDLDRDTIHGRWCRPEDGIAVGPAAAQERFVRLMLPDAVQGSFDLVAEFTRTKGSDSVTVTLPVGARACTLHFSACGGYVSGLEGIDDRTIANPIDPAVRRPGSLVNGRRYKALIAVRLFPCPRLDEHDVLIDVWLDGRPLLRWSGKESSLGLIEAWMLPERRHVGLGADKCLATFHTVRLRKLSKQ